MTVLLSQPLPFSLTANAEFEVNDCTFVECSMHEVALAVGRLSSELRLACDGGQSGPIPTDGQLRSNLDRLQKYNSILTSRDVTGSGSLSPWYLVDAVLGEISVPRNP